jgi:hypothetical protein
MKEKSRYCYKVFWTLVEHLDVFDKYKYNYGAVASCHVLPFLSPTTGSRNIRLKRHVQVLQTFEVVESVTIALSDEKLCPHWLGEALSCAH